jgi:CBS domain-containing protein
VATTERLPRETQYNTEDFSAMNQTTITETTTAIFEDEEGVALRGFRPKVHDLMSEEVLTLCPEDNLTALENIFDLKVIRHVPIVDAKSNRLVGLMTHRDFLKLAVSKLAKIEKSEEDALYAKIKIGDVMGRKVTTVRPETPLSEAALIMRMHRFGCLPVVDEDGQVVGIITEADFVSAFLRWSVRIA